jgi:hypothetical protein
MRQTFQHGIDLLARAGDDPDLLGMSLIYLHGGLEVYFRDQLEQRIALFSAREQKQPTWPDLISLWEEQGSLSPSERTTLLEYNKLRNSVAHAKTHEISREYVEKYASFVQNFTGIRMTTRPTWRSRLAWLVPIFAVFLVIIGGMWAINTSPLNQQLPPLPPTITPDSSTIRPATPEPPTILTPPTPIPTPAESSSSAKPTRGQLAFVQVDTAVPLATHSRTVEF